MLGCGITMNWSNKDRAFIVVAPELPGCMALGDDQETALPISRTPCSSGSRRRGDSAIPPRSRRASA